MSTSGGTTVGPSGSRWEPVRALGHTAQPRRGPTRRRRTSLVAAITATVMLGVGSAGLAWARAHGIDREPATSVPGPGPRAGFGHDGGRR